MMMHYLLNFVGLVTCCNDNKRTILFYSILFSNPSPLNAHRAESNSFPTARTLPDVSVISVNLPRITTLPPSNPLQPLLSTSLEDSWIFNTTLLHSRHLTGMEIRCKCLFSRRVSTCRRPYNWCVWVTGVFEFWWTTLHSSLEAGEGGCWWVNRRESGR